MSLNANQRHELSELASRAIDGCMTESEHGRLEELLKGSAEARAFYVQFMGVSSDLAWSGREAIEPPVAMAHRSTRPAFWRSAWWAAVAASLAIAVIGVWSAFEVERLQTARNAGASGTEKQEDAAGVATLSSVANVEWKNPEGPAHVGNELMPGWVRMKAGMAELDFHNGTSVWLEGPVDFRLVSAREGYCESGKIIAAVPSDAGDFLVSSPYLTVANKGTGFGVDVSNGAHAAVHVFRGQVEVTARQPAGKPSCINEGQAFVIDSSGKVQMTNADMSMFNCDEFAEAGGPWGPEPGHHGPPGMNPFGGFGFGWGPFDPGHGPHGYGAFMSPDTGWKGRDPYDSVRLLLGVDDARWAVIRPNLGKYLDAQGDWMGFAPADPAASQPNVSAATMNLTFALRNPHLTDDELGPIVAALRDARARARQKMEAAQSELNLTPEEEAKLVNFGVIQ